MSGPISGTGVIFSDDFNNNGPISSTKWNFNEWTPPNGGGSFYGRTQQRQSLPIAENGVMRLRLDTWNPPPPGWVGPWPPNNNFAFYGSEAITKQTFSVGQGIAFEARIRYAQTQPGIMGGFFTFAGPDSSHDEIDFELVSTRQNQVQTNIYHNIPLGNGNPEFEPVTKLTEWHTYRIEWTPTSVTWRVDGKAVRTTTAPTEVPTKPMNLHFNIWGQVANNPPYSDPSLNPATSAAGNQTFYMDVDWTKVETLSTKVGSHLANTLVGTANNDHIAGHGGDDTLTAGAGHDTVEGGSGDDRLHGEAGDDSLYGHAGDDVLLGHAGDDFLRGGLGADLLEGGQGSDLMNGGDGADVFRFLGASDSSGVTFDRLRGVEFAVDKFDLPTVAGPVAAIDPMITTGTLNGGAAFDTGLAAALAALAADHAVLFRPNAGLHAGHTFLVADLNGVAGYQSGQDLVMRIIAPSGTLTTANFV
jgi:hypothetical protein